MKHYADQHGIPWAFDLGVTDEVIAVTADRHSVTLTAITDDEYFAIINPPPTLAVSAVKKISELTAGYASEITGDIEYNGVIYQGDQRSLDALLSRLRIGTDPSHWRAKDNSNTAPFTIADVDALRAMIELRAAAAVEKLHSRKDAVLAAESIEAVQSIEW